MIGALKSGEFIDAARVRRISLILAALSLVSIAALLATADGVRDYQGRPLGSDFFAFWSAGELASAGAPADAYDARLHYEAHQHFLGQENPPFYPFFYPPVFLFVAATLAALPYVPAWLFYMGATLPAYLYAVRKIAPVPGAVLVALAFPAALVNFTHGQNGFLMAALIGGALVCLRTKPALAGVLIGCLAFKPQFAVLIPLAFAAGGHWRVFIAAGATLGALCLAATLAFGADIWRAFIEANDYARLTVIENGGVGWEKVQSLYAALRAFGAPMAPSLAAQGALILSLAAGVFALWRTAASFHVKAAALIVASLLASPYVFDYDLAALAPAGAFLFMRARETAFRDYEKAALAFAFLAPLVGRGIAAATLIPVGFLSLAALALVIAARARAEIRSAPAPAAAAA